MPLTSPKFMSAGSFRKFGTESNGISGTGCCAYAGAANSSNTTKHERFTRPPLWLDRGVHVTCREHVVSVHADDEVIHVGIDAAEPVCDAGRDHDDVSRSAGAAPAR